MPEVEDEKTLLLPDPNASLASEDGTKRPLEKTAAGVRDVFLMGLSSLLLFGAFTVAQNLASTVFRDAGTGFWSLGALYISFALNNLFSPWIVGKMGQKWALFASSGLYVLFVGASAIAIDNPSNLLLQSILLIGSATVLGIGAAVFWAAQGSYVTQCSTPESLGRNNGLFYLLFIGNQVVGNSVAAGLLQAQIDVSTTFKIMFAIGGCGALGFLFLRSIHSSAKDAPNSQTLSASFLLTMVLRTLRHPRFLLLSFIIIYSGVTQSFIPGTFPLLVSNQESDLAYKLFVMTVFGGADAISSVLSGYLSDRIGCLPIFYAGAAFHITAVGLLYLESSAAVHYSVAVLLGLGDGVFNTQISTALGQLFPHEESVGAFGAYKMVQSLVVGILFFASDSLTTDGNPNLMVWSAVMGGSLVLGMVTLQIFRKMLAKT